MPHTGGRLPRNPDGTIIYSQSKRALRERAGRLALKEKREQEIPFIYCRGAPGAALAGGFLHH